MYKLLISFIFFLYCTPHLKSQTLINGQISDENNNFIPWVTLLLSDSSGNILQQIHTNESGLFSFHKINETKVLVKAVHLNFQILTDTLFLNKKDIITLNYKLIPLENLIDLVEISGKKAPFKLKNDRYVIEVEGQSAFKNLNSLDILSRSPGIFIQKAENSISFLGKKNILILINGKENQMSSQELHNYLKTLPQNSIKNIELIPNPDSRYSTSVEAVININLIKNSFEDLYLSSQYTTSFGEFIELNPTIQMNLPVGNSQMYIRANHQQDTRFLEYQNSIKYENHENILEISQTGEGTRKYNNQGFTLGNRSQWNKEKTQLDFSMRHFSNNSKLYNEYTNDDTKRILKKGNKNYGIQGDLQHNFNKEGSNLSIYLYHGGNSQNEFNHLFNTKFIDSTFTFDYNKVFILKIDQIQPSKLGSLSYGLSSHIIHTKNDKLNAFYEGKINKEIVIAGYFSINRDLGKNTNLSLGLRSENSNNKTHYFPNLSISKSWDSGQSLLTSFGSGIRRPNLKQLNGFEQQMDNYSYTIGNPDLQPERSYFLSASYSPKSFLFLNGSIMHIKNIMGQEIVWDKEKNMQKYWYTNLTSHFSSSLGISYNKVLYNKIFFYMNTFVSRNYYENLESSNNYSNTTYTFHSNSTVNINLSNSSSFDFSGYYYSSQLAGYIKIDPFYSFDATLRKAFLQNKLTASLSALDLFNNLKTAYSLTQPFQSVTSISKFESRRIQLTLRFVFGSHSKRLRDLKDNSQDVQKRIQEEIKN